MKGKAALIVGLATGYVLGTRDGRGRYQQIKTQANRLMQDPRVQEKATQAQELVKEKAPLVKGKVSDATHKATSKVSPSKSGSSNGSSDESSAGWVSTPDVTTADAPTPAPATDASTDPFSSGDSGDRVDDDVIVVTAPSPSPLAPGPTPDTSTNPDGDLRG